MFRSDLAHEIVGALKSNVDGVAFDVLRGRFGLIKINTQIKTSEASHRIGKPIGNYCAIECDKMQLGSVEIDQYITKVLSVALQEFLAEFKKGIVLVVGLGNNSITADSLGPKVCNKLEASQMVKIFTPSVMGKTGIKTYDTIKAICEKIKPSVVIAIDSLCSRDVEKIGCTIQLNNTGITPGSGVNSAQDALNQKSLGVPVIALGVPMVVYAPSICDGCDKAIERIAKKFSSLYVVSKEVDIVIENSTNIISAALNLILS